MSFVEVICAYGIDELTEESTAYMASFLPRYRLRKAESYVRLSDRYNCIAAYFLLLCSTFGRTGCEQLPEVVFLSTGKPYFAEKKELFFNLSHCSGAVCCGISSDEIGVDIQDPVRNTGSIISFAMNEREKEAILASEQPEVVCAGLWSLKEAYLKYSGTGLSENMRELDLSDLLWKKERYGQLYSQSCRVGRYSVSICSQTEVTAFSSGHINDIIHRYRSRLNGGMI